MEPTTVFDPANFVPAERRVIPALPDSDHRVAVPTEAATRSPQIVPGAGPILDEDQVLSLIEMQYEEYSARRALEELFESGGLAALGG